MSYNTSKLLYKVITHNTSGPFDIAADFSRGSCFCMFRSSLIKSWSSILTENIMLYNRIYFSHCLLSLSIPDPGSIQCWRAMYTGSKWKIFHFAANGSKKTANPTVFFKKKRLVFIRWAIKRRLTSISSKSTGFWEQNCWGKKLYFTSTV